jgi:hypothetical protein
LERFDSVFGHEFPHHQRQLAVGGRLDGSPINSLNELRHEVTASVQLHNKFRIFHSVYSFTSQETVCDQRAFHFSRIGVTLTPVRDLPHSKQLAFNRDVISPQDGHILCDPYPAMRGVSLRILCSSRTANSTISRPKEKLIAVMKATFLASPAQTA